jgi:hypothetical protein
LGLVRIALALALNSAALAGCFLLAATEIPLLFRLIWLLALSAASGSRTHGLLITFGILILIFVFLVCHNSLRVQVR